MTNVGRMMANVLRQALGSDFLRMKEGPVC